MPVDQRSETAKYVRFNIDVWYQEDDRSIHITSPDTSLHTTIKNDPSSKRYHENMFKKLKEILQEQGKWPETVE